MIGGVETLGLIADKFGLSGGFWDTVEHPERQFGMLGYVIIGMFA